MKKLLLFIIMPFVIVGQDLCSGVTVELNSVTDSTVNIVISTVNSSPDFWCNYCGLVLRDNNDNIVAMENPYNGGVFYGLGPGYDELRMLDIINNMDLPFEGELHAVNGLMPNVLVDENLEIDPLNPIDMENGDIPFSMCSWDFDLIEGCTNTSACNYDVSATSDDGSCVFPQDECNWMLVNSYTVFETIPIAYFDDDCNCICINDTDGDGICDEAEENTSLDDSTESKILIKTIGFLGQESRKKGFQLKIYDDGSIEKKYIIK